MTKKATAEPTRAERKARRPQEILEAAFEEFTGKGYAATRVEDVAARLGVTKGTIYLYFPTKDALFEAMVRSTTTPFADVLASISTLKGSYSARLRDLLLLAYEKFANDRKTRELLRLALAEGARFPDIVDRHHDEFIAPLHAAIDALLKQGIASREFRRGLAAQTPEVILSSVLHIHMLRMLFADRKPLDVPAFIEAHVDLALKGLLRRT